MPRGRPAIHFTARYNSALFKRVLKLRVYMASYMPKLPSKTAALEEVIRIGVIRLEHQLAVQLKEEGITEEEWLDKVRDA